MKLHPAFFLRTAALLGGLLALPASSAHALEWEAIGPDGGGIDGFAQSPTNPERVYAFLTFRGLYRSDDRAANWAPVVPGLALDARFRAIGVSSTDPDLLLASAWGENAIFRSTDAGAHWTTNVFASGPGHIAFDPFDGQHVLAVVHTGPPMGVARSTDAGLTWAISSVALGTGDYARIAFDPSGADHVVMATSAGGYFSTDGGVTWTPSATGGGTSGAISFSESAPDVVWSSGIQGGILRSTDAGASFQNLGPPAGCNLNLCHSPFVIGSAVDVNDVFSVSTRGLGNSECGIAVQRSTNFGATWNPLDPLLRELCDNQRSTGLSIDRGDLETLFLGIMTFGQTPIRHGFLRSTDDGLSWSPRMNGLHGVSVLEIEGGASGTIYLRETTRAGLWRRASDDEDWTELHSALEDSERMTLFAAHDWHDGILYEGGSIRQFDVVLPLFFVSNDFGATWDQSLVQQAFLSQYPRVVAPDPASGQTVYLWCDDGFSQSALFRSQNAGASFSEVSDDPVPADAVVAWNSPLRLFTIAKDAPGGVRLSIDGGVTWSPRDQGLPSDEGVALFLGPFGPSTPTLLAVYRTAGAYRSTNNGLAWAPVALPGYSGEPVVDADWHAGSGTVFLATEADGVYRSDAGFVTAGLTSTELTAIEYDKESGSLYVGTKHASAFRLQSGTGVAVPVLAASSPTFAITARPHPTRGATEFEFTVPTRTSLSRIVIVDVTGRLVATPFEGELSAGRHFATWNGNSNTGAKAAPGAYFARLEADGVTTSTRITILAD